MLPHDQPELVRQHAVRLVLELRLLYGQAAADMRDRVVTSSWHLFVPWMCDMADDLEAYQRNAQVRI